VRTGNFDQASSLIAAAIAERATPGAAVEVGRASDILWRHAAGSVTYDEGALPVSADTIYDLASLTKPVATATLAMRAVESGALPLATRVTARLPDWRGTDRHDVTIRDLLAHCSGLTAYLPFFRDDHGRREFQAAIASLPLEYAPRSRAVYSDLGFMLLGFILEDALGGTLHELFDEVASRFTSAPLRFNPPAGWKARTAPTEVDAWRGRLLVGEVHDENAWALGGAAGHAGLFGTAAAVGDFARVVLRTFQGDSPMARRDTLRLFAARTADVPGSSRALAWDTMLPTSSCGTRLSPRAIGHTGFTGTSLWIDPDRDLYIVLLANRVHPSRDNNRFQSLRPLIHDAIVDAV
jgi:CubicO group peptidase (beta-lactamase class C family)